ncbi:MAG TPA: hypothetical protein VGH33_26365, partial [Isosphaeraceae bacterium]
WVTFAGEMQATIGKTPGVFVSPLISIGGTYYIGAATQNAARGLSLATVLAGDHDFGGTHVVVVVTTDNGAHYSPVPVTSSSQLATLEQTALAGNPLLSTVLVHPFFPGQPDVVYPVFTKSVVQFFDDNLADAFQNFNAVTASAFRDVLAGQVGGITVDPSTVSTGNTSPATGPALSPPWDTFHSELVATVGKTPGVYVSPLVQFDSGHYVVGVATPDFARGVSLATILAGSHDFGGVNVTVRVTDYAGNDYGDLNLTTSAQVAQVEQIALAGNPLFSTVVVHPLFPGQPDVVYPVFTKTVVQFFDDNLADAFQNFNAVTASAFGDVLAGSVGGVLVGPSTAIK